MIGYIVVGITCFFIGNFTGVLALSLCIAAKDRDEINNNVCNGCFLAEVMIARTEQEKENHENDKQNI